MKRTAARLGLPDGRTDPGPWFTVGQASGRRGDASVRFPAEASPAERPPTKGASPSGAAPAARPVRSEDAGRAPALSLSALHCREPLGVERAVARSARRPAVAGRGSALHRRELLSARTAEGRFSGAAPLAGGGRQQRRRGHRWRPAPFMSLELQADPTERRRRDEAKNERR